MRGDVMNTDDILIVVTPLIQSHLAFPHLERYSRVRVFYHLRPLRGRLHFRLVVVVAVGIDKVNISVGVKVVNVHAGAVCLVLLLRWLNDQDVADLNSKETLVNRYIRDQP
jgi:hypothetical protein